MIAERLLLILEDIRGVTGSFVTTHAGDVLVHSMPDRFDIDELKLTACRVVRILQCGSANGLQTEDGLFDFGEGKLLVREFVRGYLCVLCGTSVNMRSLRLTARLVARSMPAELRGAETSPIAHVF
jgi:hypothetical protein